MFSAEVEYERCTCNDSIGGRDYLSSGRNYHKLAIDSTVSVWNDLCGTFAGRRIPEGLMVAHWDVFLNGVWIVRVKARWGYGECPVDHTVPGVQCNLVVELAREEGNKKVWKVL